jgi:hypothetical protein
MIAPMGRSVYARLMRSTLLLAAAFFTHGLAPAQSDLIVAGLGRDLPLKVTASATERVLLVDLILDEEWHAYARDVGGGRPVGLSLDSGCDFVAAGPLRLPETDGAKLEGAVRLRLPLEHIGQDAELRATLAIQVCDALECLTPMTLTLSGEVKPLGVLLVVAAPGERTDRISGWLEARGFTVDVATYVDVTLAACDRHDVVLADSDVFRAHGVDGKTIQRFPRTATPVVAVGFLGTQLVEAHGVAMTSGYI